MRTRKNVLLILLISLQSHPYQNNLLKEMMKTCCRPLYSTKVPNQSPYRLVGKAFLINNYNRPLPFPDRNFSAFYSSCRFARRTTQLTKKNVV